MARVGRKSKYTPDCVARIVQAIKLGATYEHAAAYGGISYQTFRDWQLKKPEFSDVVKAAEGEAVIGWMAKIERAANDGVWTAAAWKLERRYPNEYGKTVQEQHHTGKDGGPLVVNIGMRPDGPGFQE